MKKVFIITGANRGLGKAFVDILIRNEDNFIISLSRSTTNAQQNYPSQNFHFIQLDLAKSDIIKTIAPLKNLISTQAIYFINNASIIEPIIKITDLPKDAIDKTIDVNIKSTILITQYLLNHFIDNRLAFVNISSGAADRAIKNWSLYCASKAYVKMFFKVAQCEYEQHRFYNIDPGVINTDMQKSIRQSDFPDVLDFQNLEKEGKLKPAADVASEILKTIS